MTGSPSTQGAEPLQTVTSAQQCLFALQQSLATLVRLNANTQLAPYILESLSHCAQLEDYVDRLVATQSTGDTCVDPSVFDGLMSLAGPETAVELLDQVLIDLQRGHQTIEQALPADDRMALRSQCHMLIAVAGAIGATSVQTSADHLNRATLYADKDTLAVKVAQLLAPLQALLGFVQRERRARGTP